MKNIKRLTIFIVFTYLSCTRAGQNSREQAVLDFEKARFNATRNSDTTRLREMLADELVWIHSSGKQQDKTAYLHDLSSGSSRYKNITLESSTVRLYGDIAITNGIARYEGISHADTFDVRAFHTAVYRLQNDLWQVISWQTTKVQ